MAPAVNINLAKESWPKFESRGSNVSLSYFLPHQWFSTYDPLISRRVLMYSSEVYVILIDDSIPKART